MPMICYTPKKFTREHQAIIDVANEIIEDYTAQGYSLTLRQLYYQFVSRDIIPNQGKQYKRLGVIISDARRAGLIDWNAIEDRMRNLRVQPSWDSPASIIDSCARQFDVDHWEKQPYYMECWVEKDALIGVLEVACNKWQIPYFSCRGYTSDSEAWAAGMRLAQKERDGKSVVILHLGDHDPSGIDMTRDIDERIHLFGSLRRSQVKRIALNMDQIEEYNPPPNPAKVTDARYTKYADLHGEESWELDALDPKTITALIDAQVEEHIDRKEWKRSRDRAKKGREQLEKIAAEINDEA